MPDLMIETRVTCKANLNWSKKYTSSSGNGTYTVHYGPVHGGQYSHDYTCDCPAGQHGKMCKHVKQAQQDKCDWGWEAFCGDDPQPNADGTCPNCGGPTTGVRIAV